MKILFHIVLIFGIFIGCNKTDDNSSYKIINGMYVGYYSYKGNNYWHSINLDHNKYEEFPSGGVFYQKDIICLTVGSFSTNRENLIFEPDSFKFGESDGINCNSDLILSGDFKINYIENDSISFEKEAGEKRIIYFLKRYKDNEK